MSNIDCQFPVSVEGANVAEKYASADSGLTITVRTSQNKRWDLHVMPLEAKSSTAIAY